MLPPAPSGRPPPPADRPPLPIPPDWGKPLRSSPALSSTGSLPTRGPSPPSNASGAPRAPRSGPTTPSSAASVRERSRGSNATAVGSGSTRRAVGTPPPRHPSHPYPAPTGIWAYGGVPVPGLAIGPEGPLRRRFALRGCSLEVRFNSRPPCGGVKRRRCRSTGCLNPLLRVCAGPGVPRGDSAPTNPTNRPTPTRYQDMSPPPDLPHLCRGCVEDVFPVEPEDFLYMDTVSDEPLLRSKATLLVHPLLPQHPQPGLDVRFFFWGGGSGQTAPHPPN